ncbi:MAG: NAD(P)H-hydrate dehydratase [Candidatus Latescibacteria bacterium]|nr:NAD(P)H-hydrate dehydratase [Candidatus Latescibacterota bacterium]
MDAIQLVTGSQMAAIDRRAVNSGIPGIDLMESAGQGIARIAKELLNGFANRHIAVLCGKGNNGGDGFVLARWAAEQGAKVHVFLFATPEEIQGDAKTNFERIEHLPIVSVTEEKVIHTVQNALKQTDLVIDALLGTGINSPVHGIIAQAINLLKQAKCPILAVDVPSGLNADTGQGDCASATQTVTFACPRIGHFFYPGRTACRHVSLIDIGIPKVAVTAESSSFFLIDAKWASQALPQRTPDAHKGNCGRVFILAGSVGLTGAAALSATAAVRSGSGLVSLGIPKSLNDILECKVTEAMTRPLPEIRKARCLALNARGEIASLIAKADAVAIGPGLGTHRQTITLVHRLIEDLTCPTVIDADALNALVGHLDVIKNCTTPLVLTPHLGEFSRLTGQSIEDIRKDPITSAQKFAQKLGHIVILKGGPTIVAEPNGHIHINPTGNAGMATGGTGDILTGLIASFIGQGLSPSVAARLGVYIHGLAGDLVAEKKGQMGLTAGDVVQALPKALVAASQTQHPKPYLTQVAL